MGKAAAILAALALMFFLGAPARAITYTTLDDPLGVKGTFATGVSGNTIVGYYYGSDGIYHGFVTVVPEPSGVALALIGLASVVAYGWRRTKSPTTPDARRLEVNRIVALLVLSCALLVGAPGSASAVTIDWVSIGDAGNAADTTGHGAVAYSYDIAANDVTVSQYVEFLNLKDPDGNSPLELYNSNMSNAITGGIAYNGGATSGSKYSVIAGDGSHPMANVTWYDAIRFANWLNNGQGNGDTETGAYTLGALRYDGTPVNPNAVTRNAGATVFLPSEDEWYKAAYYDPRTTAEGGPPSDSHYWLYPTSSNTAPTATSPTSTPNSANYYPGGPSIPTDVGAYSGTTSPSGAYDMAGNVWQWNEALLNGTYRGLRGGSFAYSPIPDELVSSTRIDGAANLIAFNGGFRVALVPEPSTLVLAAFGLIGLAAWGWRRKR